MQLTTYQELEKLAQEEDIPSDFISEAMEIMGYEHVDFGVYIKPDYLDIEDSVGFILGYLQDTSIIMLDIWGGVAQQGYHYAVSIKDSPDLLRLLDSFFDMINEKRLDEVEILQ